MIRHLLFAILAVVIGLGVATWRVEFAAAAPSLRDPSPERRLAAIIHVGRTRSASAETIAALAAELPGTERYANAAAWALGELGPAAVAAVPHLIERSRAGSDALLLQVIRALWRVAPDDPAVVGALQQLRTHHSGLVRSAAAGLVAKAASSTRG